MTWRAPRAWAPRTILIAHNPLGLGRIALAVGAVAAGSYATSRPLPGLGIGMPLLVAPVTAAIVAIVLGQGQSPSLAYIGGTRGVPVGPDVLRIREVRRLGVPTASIGGAGTFDGIFVTGLVAVLLA